MGNKCGGGSADPDSAWKAQNKEAENNIIFKYVNFAGGGKLIEEYKKGGEKAVEQIAKTELQPLLFNDGNGKIVKKVDFIKWRYKGLAKITGSTLWETRTDEQLLDEYKQDYFNKVYEHEACWNMDMRGPVGETSFHILYLMDSAVHMEVANVLLRLYPKLSLDVYEGDEYYGESALHIAIVFGNLEAVKNLIECGANVHQRATGRFFLPEDQKGSRKGTTNYEGYAYYGEYPLAFAACSGNMEIYDYLIDHDADPNLQDSFGNTVLHMVVISNQVEMYKYIVRHIKRPAKTDIVNKANLTPLTLASKLGRHKIFKEMLELGSLELWRYSNITCSLYPLLALDSIGPKGETNWNSALMIIINGETDEHLEMLEGGVIRQLLMEKWKTFAKRRFFVRLVLAFIHLTFISIAVYTRPGSNLLAYHEPKDGVRFGCEILTCLACLIVLILDFREIGSQGILTFLKNCRHEPTQTIFKFSCLMILMCIPFRILEHKIAEDVLLIIAIPGAWYFLLFFASSFSLTGPFVSMIYKMFMGDLLRFGIIYIIFLIGFTQAFYFLFQGAKVNQSQAGFNSLSNTVLTLFQMTLGEFKYQEFNLTKYSGLTKMVFAVFMLLVPILLLNMLIAMMGNTYATVIAKSEKEWRRQWAKIVVVMERDFSKKKLLEYQKEYAIKLVGKPKENLAEITDSEVDEQRALMVIKTSEKTKAKQRKGAVHNWKSLGKEVMRQIKRQRLLGIKGPIILTEARRRKTSAHQSDYYSDDDDSEKGFAQALQQMAWQKDIDLTKGYAFIKDPSVIEKHSPRLLDKNDKNEDKSDQRSMSSHSHNQIPNGKPKTMERTVKKPAGTPKSSPASSTSHQFSYNRVSPLTLMKQPSPADDSNSDIEGSKPVVVPDLKGMSIGEISLHGGVSYRQPRLSVHFDDDDVPSHPKTLLWNVPKVDYKPSVKSDDSYTSQGSGVSSKASKQSSKSVDSSTGHSSSQDLSSQTKSQNCSSESSKSSLTYESSSYRRHHKQKKNKKSKGGSRTSSTTSLIPTSSEADSKESEL